MGDAPTDAVQTEGVLSMARGRSRVVTDMIWLHTAPHQRYGISMSIGPPALSTDSQHTSVG